MDDGQNNGNAMGTNSHGVEKAAHQGFCNEWFSIKFSALINIATQPRG